MTANTKLVARCGLYCGSCRAYRKRKCPGCAGNEKASWCKVRKCCIEHCYDTCADCVEFDNPAKCSMLISPVSKVIGFVLRTDRAASLAVIKAQGREAYAEAMASSGRMSVRR